MRMRTPPPRGAHSAAVIARITGADLSLEPWQSDVDVLADDDFQLSLWVLYELHYQGFEDALDDAEWDPDLLEARRDLESHFDAALRREAAALIDTTTRPTDLTRTLTEFINDFEGTSLTAYLHQHGNAEHIRDLLAQRSVLQLKEADPYTWVIPRLANGPKVALVELQFDEYGDGKPERLHQELYAQTLTEVGLKPQYGAYLPDACAQMLALSNAPSFFGLHRRLRGSALGHLAAFESTSSVPSRQYADLMRKAGFSDTAACYFDEHVEADAIHEQIAVRDICGGLVKQDPDLAVDVMHGAAICLALDDRFACALIDRWEGSN